MDTDKVLTTLNSTADKAIDIMQAIMDKANLMYANAPTKVSDEIIAEYLPIVSLFVSLSE